MKLKKYKRQLEEIKKRIDGELRIRCINVETKLELVEKKNKKIILKLSSTKFNTVPVLHSEIEIKDFGGSIWQDEKKKNIIHFFVSVHASYAGNAEGLFDVEGIFDIKDKWNIYFEGGKGVDVFIDLTDKEITI